MNISPISNSTYRPTKRVVETSIIDYRPYVSKGFFISPDPYTKDFEPIGEIRIEVTPALVKQDYSLRSSCYVSMNGVWEEVVPADELLREAVNQAINLQANAIVNLKITTVQIDEEEQQILLQPLRKYILSGFCIVRK